jgi:2-polyprenyl-3-methyl-5-hydroxy-6-metoxy-1,4-benzoquinol methylase
MTKGKNPEIDNDEYTKLEEVSEKYDPSNPENDFDYWIIQYDFHALNKWIIGDKVIELGCGKGVLTKKLARKCKELKVVEGSLENINHVKNELNDLNNISYYHSLWQDFNYKRNDISDVVFSSGLEHINKEVSSIIFNNIKNWLKPGGKLHIIVPNSNSLHRKVALYMGLIKDVHELSPRDLLLKHERVFDKDLLFEEIKENGFIIKHQEGIFLKPLPNSMMMKLKEDVIRGFGEISVEYPDDSAHIYVVCENKH